MRNKPVHLLLIASSGGHFIELYFLKPFWQKHNYTWVTFKTQQTEGMIGSDENVIWAYAPTNRNLPNLLRNISLAWKVLRKKQYTHIVTTGAGVAIPFIWVGKLFNVYSIFIDSFTRTRTLSLSAKLVYSIADDLLTQWPAVAESYSRVVYKGKVL